MLSSTGVLVLIRPSTTPLFFGTKRSGLKSPARGVSYSSRKWLTFAWVKSRSATELVAPLPQIMALEVAAAHMDPDHDLRWARGSGVIDAVDIEIDEPIGLAAGALDLAADRRVAQQGDGDLIELNVTTSCRCEVPHLRREYGAKIRGKFCCIRIDAAIGKIGAAIEVHRRRRRQGDLRRDFGGIAQESELVERQGACALDFALCVRRRELNLVPVIVAEHELGGTDFKSVGALDEAAPIGRTTKFAIGDDRKTHPLLHADGVADAMILDAAECLVVEFMRRMLTEGLPQFRRPQQAADMIGTERRAAVGADRHERFLAWQQQISIGI